MRLEGTSGGGSCALRAKNLGHKYTKGKAHYIKVYSNNEPKEDVEQEADHGDGGPQFIGGPPPPQGGGPCENFYTRIPTAANCCYFSYLIKSYK